MTIQKIRVADLDFDSIKQSFIDYLKTTSEFTDYNFQASGLSTILNVLAYNSHYQSLMANFLANEMFLDTAVKRSSIVSRAKELGYVPRSTRAAKAIVNVEFRSVFGNPSSLVLPAGTTFIGKIDNNSYVFTTITSYSATAVIEDTGLVYRFSNVEIFEGVLTANTFLYNPVDYTITIPNLDIDTTTLRVFVQTQNDSRVEEYQRNFNFLTIGPTDRVFFIQEGFNSYYEVYFGDNVFGYQPAANSKVEMNYLVTSGSEGNNATDFTLTYFPAGTESSTNTVTTVSISSGGMDREEEDLIKFNAINSYGTQNRAVVADDYKALIIEGGGGFNVKNVLTWGGEDNIPPKFGTIMVCVQPLTGDSLTANQKSQIISLIKSKAVGNTRVEFVDPEYIDIVIKSTVVYDKSLLSVGTYELESEVIAAIIRYVNSSLSTFSNVFRLSNLMTDIDSTNTAILNNKTYVFIEKWVYPKLFTAYSSSFSFMNPINSVYSTTFYDDVVPDQLHMEDDTVGNINVVYYSGSKKVIYKSNVGSVNYQTGNVQVDNVKISRYDNVLKFIADPISQDIVSNRNVILRLQSSNIHVSSMADYT
jgi:hypothetical protein